MKLNIPFLMKNLTIEEKAGLCSGKDFFTTKAVERLGIPSIMVCDGPHGLRKQDSDGDHMGMHESVKAVCFPAGSTLASSFDRSLIHTVGEYLGEEARAESIHTILGPAINIKRSPLCGRNFEYMSEDPFLAGELAASYVMGVQSKNVGVSVKHFAANNQEYHRMSTDVVVSERALHEIYLAAFEKTVKKAYPWTLMCAYNQINGTYCCENKWLLTDVLREEWGFDGVVISDWGATNNRVNALAAGLELEMPYSYGFRDREIVAAVKSGMLPESVLDTAVERLLQWINKGLAEEPVVPAYNKEDHHAFVRKAAAECAVLLKNSGNILPLSKDKNVLFVGCFAAAPRFQGGGSSHINCFKVTNAVDASKGLQVTYLPGWNTDGESSEPAAAAAAIAAAATADAVVVFAGLPESFEGEGCDRLHMDLPACQNELISALAAVQPNTVVVLHCGSPVTMPWEKDVAAILNLYLAGQAAGEAAVDLLFGDASPSGRLAETYPLRLEDTPPYLNFPGSEKRVHYGEDVYIGYRWYDSRKMDVLYPFGFGLSYTTFEISNLQAADVWNIEGHFTVTADVTNTGSCAGKHVVQLYIAPPATSVMPRPVHELKGFAKVELAPGETKTVSFILDSRSFSYYNSEIHDWYVESGAYTIEVGSSCRDLPLTHVVSIQSAPLPFEWKDTLTVADIVKAGKSDAIADMIGYILESFGIHSEKEIQAMASDKVMQAMVGDMALHSMGSFAPMPEGYLQTIQNRLDCDKESECL